jgi:predicted DCC family thiol-disulfide oxidoreductase YuxK
MSSIVLFDGVCNFCSEAVNFVIKHDRENKFRFAPLQSDIGRDLREKYEIDESIDSIVLIEDGQAFVHSSAALRLMKGLGGIWSLAYVFAIIPQPIRDYFYKLFAKLRYRLFGKHETCMVPTPEIRAKFL